MAGDSEERTPARAAEERAENVKHLEMIQAVIARLASNSFLIKGGALTLSGAAFGFAVNRVDWRVAAAASFVLLGLWILDSYYLRQERMFRMLYNKVRRTPNPNHESRFSMNVAQFKGFHTTKVHQVFFSLTLTALYLTLLVAGSALSLLFWFTAPAVPP